ncbi:putative amidohydrolase protein [Eutypa lata UCREL1]|uniref:Putative amidohydrolase protein n=1 Tax=Eutypa lata (strain UCR-EL1) TaxID=1287681 RepID=M7TQL5_EUTLA|nr:putative amidohydrolase protein [Eutypa lata UCREL1]
MIQPTGEEDITSQVLARSIPAAISKTAIQNVRVFDGNRFMEPRTVVLDGGNIVDSESIETTVDGSGQFLIPGFFDTHLHISTLAGLENATSYGLTTVMNMACRNCAACWPLRDQIGLASFFSAGIPATGANSSHAKSMQLPDSMVTHPDTNMTELVAQAFSNSSDFYKTTAEINEPTQQQ